MNTLSPFILQEIFYFLDTDSLKESTLVNKLWLHSIRKDSFWRVKFQKKSFSSYHSGPYFKFSGYKTYLDSLDCEKFEVSNFLEMKKIAHKLENPQKLTMKSMKASSALHIQGPLWSSAGNISKDSNETIIVELLTESLIFSFNFIIFRSFRDEGVLFPPRSVKLSIGNDLNCSDYETDEFDVDLTENYNTILVLPKLVSGKFIKLEMIGKQNKLPGSVEWFTILKLFEIIGYPENYEPDPLLLMCKNGEVETHYKPLSPFYLERLEKFGMIGCYFEKVKTLDSDTSSYLYEIYKESIQRSDFNVRYCEALGNYFFDRGNYEVAKMHYLKIRHVWGYAKVLIVTRDFGGLCGVMFEDHPNRPNLAWVLKTAGKLGGHELQDEIRNAFRSND